MSKCLLCGNRINSPLSLAFLISVKAYHQPIICSQCRAKFKRIKRDHCCKDCSRAGDFKHRICPDCVRWRRLTGMRFQNYSLYRYNSMMSEYMHRYKFMGDYRLRRVFMNQFKDFVMKSHRELVPVPLHQGTYRQRGFNQVKGLLGSLSTVKALKTKRADKSVPQSHKRRSDRLRLPQPFSVLTGCQNKIKDRDLAVVDDVYTTGTTIRHAASQLRQAGAKSVIGITLAR